MKTGDIGLSGRKITGRLFLCALLFTALTGLAQMPIFKRYRIADLPGLGWLADFFITYFLHYVSAAILLAISVYVLTDYVLNRSKFRVTVLGYARVAVLFMIFISGFILVFRNMPGYRFSPGFVISLDFAHLGFMLLYIIAALAALITRQKWLKE